MIGQGPARSWSATTPYLHSVLRMVAAFVFMQHGAMKLFAFPAGIPPHGSTVALVSQAGLAGVLEFFCGLLLVLGLFTRPAAFLVAGEMAVAYFQVHFPRGFWTAMNGGEGAVLFCFLWLYFSASGPGPWSLDALLRNRTTGRKPGASISSAWSSPSPGRSTRG